MAKKIEPILCDVCLLPDHLYRKEDGPKNFVYCENCGSSFWSKSKFFESLPIKKVEA